MKTIQVLSKLVARELGKEEKLCDSVNDFYWKEVRKKLSNMESASISLKHIGTITTSKRKIDHFIRMTIGKIRNIRKSIRFKESTKDLLLDINYNRLRKALVQRNKLATQYHEAYLKRASRIREVIAGHGEKRRPDSGWSDDSGKDGIQYVAGGRTSGDSAPEIHMRDVSLQ